MGFSPQTEVGTTLAFNSRDFASTVRHPTGSPELKISNFNLTSEIALRVKKSEVEVRIMLNFFSEQLRPEAFKIIDFDR